MLVVTSTEFAKIAKVSRQAIAKALKAGKLRNVGKEKRVKIDMHDGLAEDYLKAQHLKEVDGTAKKQIQKENSKKVNHEQPKQHGNKEKLTPIEEEAEKIQIRHLEEIRNKSDYSKLKDKTAIDKMNLEMDKQLGNLLSKEIVNKKFGQMSSVILNYMHPLGDRLSAIIAGIFESTDNAKILETKKVIDDETMKAITEFKKACTTNDIEAA